MAIGSGLGAQLGIAPETTYGTYVAPTKFIEFTKESLVLKKTTAQSAGIAAGRLLALSSRRVLTRREASGSIDLEVTNKGMGLLLQALMGTTVTPVQQGAGPAYLQTHTRGHGGQEPDDSEGHAAHHWHGHEEEHPRLQDHLG